MASRGKTTRRRAGLGPRQDGLGFVAASACPRYLEQPKRRPGYQRVIAEAFPGGLAIDNFRGQQLVEVVAERSGSPGSFAVMVSWSQSRWRRAC